jgi:hypothetical protein
MSERDSRSPLDLIGFCYVRLARVCRMAGLLIVANLSETTATQVSLTVPKGLTGDLVSAFKGRPAGLTLADGKLTGEIGKAEVHVYRVVPR